MRYIVVLLVLALAGCSKPPPAYESRYSAPVTTKPPVAEKVVIIGDSYTTQPPPWPNTVAQELGLKVIVGGEGGSGYTQPGKSGTVFRERIAKLVSADDTLVVLFGGRNDRNASPQAVESAVNAAIAQTRQAAPRANLLVVGPVWPEGAPPPEVLTVRDILQKQALEAGAVFVDPIAEHWLTEPGLVQGDGIHPNEAGNAYLAEKMLPLIRSEV